MSLATEKNVNGVTIDGLLTSSGSADEYPVTGTFRQVGGVKTWASTIQEVIQNETLERAPDSIYIIKGDTVANNGVWKFINGSTSIQASSFEKDPVFSETSVSEILLGATTPANGSIAPQGIKTFINTTINKQTAYVNSQGFWVDMEALFIVKFQQDPLDIDNSTYDNPNVATAIFNPDIKLNKNAIYISVNGSIWRYDDDAGEYKMSGSMVTFDGSDDPNSVDATFITGTNANTNFLYVGFDDRLWRYNGVQYSNIRIKPFYGSVDNFKIDKNREFYFYTQNSVSQQITFEALNTFSERIVCLINPTNFQKTFQSGFSYTDAYNISRNFIRPFETLYLYNDGNSLKQIVSSNIKGYSATIASITVGNNTITHNANLPTGRFSNLILKAYDSTGNELFFRRIFASDTANAIVINSTLAYTNVRIDITFNS